MQNTDITTFGLSEFLEFDKLQNPSLEVAPTTLTQHLVRVISLPEAASRVGYIFTAPNAPVTNVSAVSSFDIDL